jgi:hypothetical protein
MSRRRLDDKVPAARDAELTSRKLNEIPSLVLDQSTKFCFTGTVPTLSLRSLHSSLEGSWRESVTDILARDRSIGEVDERSIGEVGEEVGILWILPLVGTWSRITMRGARLTIISAVRTTLGALRTLVLSRSRSRNRSRSTIIRFRPRDKGLTTSRRSKSRKEVTKVQVRIRRQTTISRASSSRRRRGAMLAEVGANVDSVVLKLKLLLRISSEGEDVLVKSDRTSRDDGLRLERPKSIGLTVLLHSKKSTELSTIVELPAKSGGDVTPSATAKNTEIVVDRDFARPSRLRNATIQSRVGTTIDSPDGVTNCLRPEATRHRSLSEQRTSSIEDGAKGTLSETVLLRSVGDGELVCDALLAKALVVVFSTIVSDEEDQLPLESNLSSSHKLRDEVEGLGL